ncbi:MAG: hypothetical protein ACLR5G_00125 [Eubacteriales bacterium]
MQKKALVIVNQHTARPKLRSDLLDILDTITKGGYDCLVRPTQSPATRSGLSPREPKNMTLSSVSAGMAR